MSKHSEVLYSVSRAGETVIGIAGLGYVGLPLAQHFVKVGLRVVAVDTDPDKIARLRRGESDLLHLSAAWVPDAIEQNIFFPTADYDALLGADAVIICVPTPLNSHREPDLSATWNRQGVKLHGF